MPSARAVGCKIGSHGRARERLEVVSFFEQVIGGMAVEIAVDVKLVRIFLIIWPVSNNSAGVRVFTGTSSFFCLFILIRFETVANF